jgi:glycosyltransferase involved in cell wall biosynthesis
MRIAVNTRLLLTGKLEGIGWFTFETLKRITRLNPDCEFFFLFDRPFSDEFIFSGNITPVVLPPQSRHPLLWYGWLEYSVPRALKKTGAELFLSPDGFLSLSTNIPSIAVIHDINFMHMPEFHPWLTRAYYRHYFPLYAGKADRIATVSEYSKNDISGTFDISPDKIDVVYNGAGQVYRPLSEDEKARVKNDLSSGIDYFLYVGSFHKRKNISRLLEAYDLFRRESARDIKLVLVGEKMYDYPQMNATLGKMIYREDVIFTGRMELPGLRRTYGAALALVYVPLFEGFGIPILEAMYCDIPVIASNRTSLPEVAGDAALLVDPENTASVAGGMHRIASDPEFRNMLIERSAARRNMFSWDRTATLLWESVLKVTSRI